MVVFDLTLTSRVKGEVALHRGDPQIRGARVLGNFLEDSTLPLRFRKIFTGPFLPSLLNLFLPILFKIQNSELFHTFESFFFLRGCLKLFPPRQASISERAALRV